MPYLLVGHASVASLDGEDVTTVAINTSGANFLAATIASYQTAGATTIQDSYSNTWVPRTAVDNTPVRLQTYEAVNATTGPGHTFTTVNVATNYPTLCVAAFSGGPTSAAFDQQSTATHESAATLAAGSVTPTQVNELLIAGAWAFTSVSIASISGGFTILENNPGVSGQHFGGALAYAIQTTATAANPAWTFGASSACGVSIATYKASAVADTTPPVLSAGSPSGLLSAGTTSTTLSVTTNEAATCKWGIVASTAYASIANTFSTTGGTSHSTTMSGLADDTSYTVYVRAQDAAGNPTLSDYTISFSVAAASAGVTFTNLLDLRDQLMRADARVTVLLAKPGATSSTTAGVYLVKDPDPGDTAVTGATTPGNAKGGSAGGYVWKEYSYDDLATAYGLTGVPGGGGGDAETVIAASTWRWDGNSGMVLVSSGFPLQPGQVTSATVDEVRVYVAGVEKAVAIHPLDGTFPDGSYRSLGLQFSHNLTHNTPVSAEVHVNAGARATTDLTWVEPTRAVHVLKKAVIAPTAPAHLCGTLVTLAPLTPATNDAGAGASWAAWATFKWTEFGTTTTGENPGTAIYDHVAGLWALYCRTGTRAWYQYAYDWATGFAGDTGLHANANFLTLMEPLLPNAGAGTLCMNHAIWNPEGLVNTIVGDPDCGHPNEANGFGRWVSLCAAYWMTGYRQFKRMIALETNYVLVGTETSFATYRDRTSIWYNHRFNLRFIWTPVLAGYVTASATGIETPGGFPAVTNFDYATYLDWILDTLEYYEWDLPGDYRNGLVGQRHTTIDPVVSGNPSAGEDWGITNFQLALMAEFLMMYYDHCAPDARIPTWMTAIADYMIAQSRQSLTGLGTDDFGFTFDWNYPTSWVSPYINQVPPVTGLVDDGQPQVGQFGYITGHYLAMFPATFAWVYAYTGNSTYLTWADRAAVTENTAFQFQTKNWGEYFGGTRQAYLYYRRGGAIRGVSGAHPTVITNPPAQPTLG